MDADYSTGSLPHLRALRFPQEDRPIPLDYDFEEDRVYWADYKMDIIRRSKLDGSQVETIAVLGNGKITGFVTSLLKLNKNLLLLEDLLVFDIIINYI